MFFGNKITDMIADRVANSVYLMRDFTLDRPRNEVIHFWQEKNRGKVIIEDSDTFIIQLEDVFPFSLVCKSPLEGDDTVRAVIMLFDKPYGNIHIKCNSSTMKYFLDCPLHRLNRKEKRMCQFLAEQRDIGLAYEYCESPSSLPPVPSSVHLPAAQQFGMVIVAMADGELDLREQEVLMHYLDRVMVGGKSPDEKKEFMQKTIDFVEEHGTHSSVDFVKHQFIKDPNKVPKVHAEVFIKLCIELALVDGTVTVDECELILFLGVHALGLEGGKDVGRLFNVTIMEHELLGHDMSHMRAAMNELTQKLQS